MLNHHKLMMAKNSGFLYDEAFLSHWVKIVKRLFFGLMMLLTPFLWANNLLEEIKERGYVRIAVIDDAFPFGYRDEKGNLQGIDVELGKQLAKDLVGDAEKIEWIITDYRDRIPKLKAKQADIVLANFTHTASRSRAVHFARPYTKVFISVASPKSKGIRSLSDLNGKRVVVPAGTTAERYFLDHHPEVILVPAPSETAAIEALKKGEGDAISHDNIMVLNWVKNNPELDISIPLVGNIDFIAPSVDKDQEALFNWLNHEMETLLNNGTLDDIYKRTLIPLYGDEHISDILIKQ